MSSGVANTCDLYIERGGFAYRLMQRIGLIQGEGPSLARRIVWFLVLLWVPLLAFAFWEGHAWGPTPRESMLLDFATLTRIIFAVPLLVIAEVVVGPRITTAGLHFLEAGLVRPADFPKFERAIARLAYWRDAAWVEIALLLLAFVGSWTVSAESVVGAQTTTWQAVTMAAGESTRLSLTGIWYHAVGVTVIQFLLFRWLWRYGLWVRFLFDVSRLDLDLVPTHADAAGGLGFLGTAQTSFGILIFAMSSVLSAAAAFLIVFEKTPIDQFTVHFVTVVVISELLLLGPLLLFTPALIKARLAWLRKYSLLVLRYNRAFHAKWIDAGTTNDESLLGSGDIQSLADLGGSYEFIKGMKFIPFSVRVIIQIALLILVPALPLVLLVMPIEKVLDLLTKAVL